MDIKRLTGINHHPFRRPGPSPEDGTAVERLHRGLGIGGHVLREVVVPIVSEIPEIEPTMMDNRTRSEIVLRSLRLNLAGQS